MQPKDLLRFDKMVTPLIIQILFWIGLALSVLFGLVLIFQGLTSQYRGGFTVFMGLLYLVVGPIVVRIYCELLIVFFKIHENLVAIKDALAAKPTSAPPPPPEV
jgi:hypothetical protein